MRLQAHALRGFGRQKHLLHRPLLFGGPLAAQSKGGEAIKKTFIRRVNSDLLTLQMGRKLGGNHTVGGQHADDVIAIGLTDGSLLQVEQVWITGGNLHPTVSQRCGPAGHVFERVKRLLAPRQLG